MYKTIFYSFLTGVVVTALLWFVVGRITTSDIQRVVERVDRDLEGTEYLVSEFGDNFNRYAGEMAVLNTESHGLWEQADNLRERSSEHVGEYEGIQSELQYFADGTNDIEESVRRSVVLSRDFADVLYWYRRRGEADAAPE